PGPDGIQVDGTSVERAIRTAEAGEAASRVALHPALRKKLVSIQRSLARAPGLVMEGRDIGTVGFPDADLKIYLTRAREARAERRFLELQARGEPADRDAIVSQIRERDRRDSERAASPLVQAPDAIPLDTTCLDPDGAVSLATSWAERARLPVRR